VVEDSTTARADQLSGSLCRRRQAIANSPYQLVGHDRLVKHAVVAYASPEDFRRSRHDDDWDLARLGVRKNLIADREPVDAGEDEIENDQIRGPVFEDVQGGQAVRRLGNIKAGKPERVCEHVTKIVIIFDQQDFLGTVGSRTIQYHGVTCYPFGRKSTI
jgi:hypothetical protein